MYDIKIHVQAAEKFSEFLPGMSQEIECAIEDIVGCALLQVFNELHIIEVTLSCNATGQSLKLLSSGAKMPLL